MEPERIYSTSQLVEALQSGLLGLKEQLQVLNILDGSASSWPGLDAAVTDLESLIALSGKRISALEDKQQQLQHRNTKLDGQLTGLQQSLAAANSKLQKVRLDLSNDREQCRQLQQKLTACEQAADSSKRQVWNLERTRADLEAAVAKAKSEGEFMEGELAGVREQLEEQKQQVSNLKEELASRRSELMTTSTLLQENRGQLDDLKTQLTQVQQQSRKQLDAAQQLLLKSTDSAAAQLRQVQDNLGSQVTRLQIELTSARMENQQLHKETSQLQQEVSSLTAALQGSQSEVARLREFQEVVKRVAEDKVQEVNAAMASLQHQMQQQQAAAADDLKSLQDKLRQREAESSGLQRQVSLMQVQMREAQRAQAAAAEAQAAAGSTLDAQKAEITTLQHAVRDASLAVERMKADHMLAESALRELHATDSSMLRQQLDESRREAAVARAMVDAWQRDSKALQDRILQLESAAAAASSAVESAHTSATQERLTLHTQAAAQEAAVKELKLQLEEKKQEILRLRAEAASVAKRYEQALVKLRREADAGAEEVRRLHQMHDTAMAVATALPAAAQHAAGCSKNINLAPQAVANQQHSQGSEPPTMAAAGVPIEQGDTSRSLKLPRVTGSPSAQNGQHGQVQDHIQQELNDLKSYMRTVSSNLEAADAAMRAVAAAAAHNKQTTPSPQTAAAQYTTHPPTLVQTSVAQAADSTGAHSRPDAGSATIEQFADITKVSPATADLALQSKTESLVQPQPCGSAIQPVETKLKACDNKTFGCLKTNNAKAAVEKSATSVSQKHTATKLPAAAKAIMPAAGAMSSEVGNSATKHRSTLLMHPPDHTSSTVPASHRSKAATAAQLREPTQQKHTKALKSAATHHAPGTAAACRHHKAKTAHEQGGASPAEVCEPSTVPVTL